MALETIGVLVNIAGDTGNLVNSIQKANAAFKALTTQTKAMSQDSMPAFQRLSHQIDAVKERTEIAKRQQAEYNKVLESGPQRLGQYRDALRILTDQMKRYSDYGEKAPKELASAFSKATAEVSRQESLIARATKGAADYENKIKAAAARIAKLEGEQKQVRVPEQQTTMQKLFTAFSAGAGAFNVITSMLGQVGRLFGGGGKPSMGGRVSRDEMAFDKMAMDIRAVGDSIPVVNVGFRTMAAAMAVGQVAANLFLGVLRGIVNAAIGAGQSILNLGIQSTLAAGRNQELAIVSQYMGQQAGHSSAEIDKVTASLKKAGASTAAANDTITQFSRSNMDLKKSTELLSVAQGAAIIAGQDSSAVMQQLIYGIITLQPEMLRTAGIVINADQAYKNYAATLKVNVNSLTGEQKQQAFLNETLREGAKLQGLYAEAMKLPGKQLRSLTDREIPDLLSQLGTPFQGVFKIVVESLRGAVKWLTEATVEGGKLYPIMQALGGAFDKVANTIKALVDQGGKAFDSLIEGWSTKISSFIINAGTWGSNLVVSFANGILSGAGAVLDALGYIGSLIAYWLQPGSPPKLLPELTRWGQAAIGEYIKGWTEADLSTFDTLANKLEGALKSMEDSIGKTNVVPAILSMRVGVANAVQEMEVLGKVTDVTLNKIMASFGSAGPLVRKYVVALLDVAKAQKELDDITKKYDDELTKLNEQLNAMTEKKTEQTEDAQIKALQRVMTRVSSTDKQKAAAQAEIDELQLRKKIRLTENEKETAVKAAQLKLDAANKNLIIQQALLDNQQKTNDLMREQATILEQVAKAAEKAAAALKGAGGGGAGGVKPVTPIKPTPMTGTYLPGMQGQGMGVAESPIKTTLDKLAELQGKWNDFKAGWDEFWRKPQVQNVTRALQYVWNDIKSGKVSVETFKTAIKSLMTKEDQKKFDEAFNSLSKFGGTEMKAAESTVKSISDSFTNLLAAISGKGEKETPQQSFERFLTFIAASTVTIGLFGSIVIDTLSGIISLVRGDYTNAFQSWKANATKIFKLVGIDANGFIDILEKLLDGFTKVKDFVEGKLSAAFLALQVFLAVQLTNAITGILTAFQNISDFINKTLIPGFTTLKDFFLNTLIPLALDPLKKILGELWDKAQGVIDSIKWIKDHIDHLNPFSKNNAEGGPVQKGIPSLVGERGLEMFVPKSDGFILPNNFLQNMVKMAMPSNYINTNSGNRSVQYVKNSYLNVNSSVSSQGLVADWARLQVLGA